MRCHLLVAAAVVSLTAGLAVGEARAADAVPAYVTAAVADVGRPFEERARDTTRKPADVLAFSGIEPGQTIAELIPGDGYYTRILSKLVGPEGKLYTVVLHFHQTREARKPENHVDVDKALAIQNIADYRNVEVLWEMPWQNGGQFSVPVQLDAVFTADGYHDLREKEDVPYDVNTFSKEVFRSLKPGGTYTIADYAAANGAGARAAAVGRSDPDAVKAELMAAGFQLDGESQVLANGDDNLSAPPTGDGADQFVLRFKKPDNASRQTLRPTEDVMTGYYGNTSISGQGSPTERHVFYHPDGTYQEFGAHDMQAGTWYWDAAGHNCMIHQYPVEQRQFIVCHATGRNRKVGDHWTQDNGSGQNQPERPYTIAAGYVHF